MKNIILIAIFSLILSIDSIIEYHDNGMPKIIATYKGSNSLELTKKVGYYDNGEKHYEINYYKGNVKSSQIWDKDGEKITDSVIEEITDNKNETNYIDELLNMHEKQNEKIIYMQKKIDSLEFYLSRYNINFNDYKVISEKQNDSIKSDINKLPRNIENEKNIRETQDFEIIDLLINLEKINSNIEIQTPEPTLIEKSQEIRREMVAVEQQIISTTSKNGKDHPSIKELKDKYENLEKELKKLGTKILIGVALGEDVGNMWKKKDVLNKKWDEDEAYSDVGKDGCPDELEDGKGGCLRAKNYNYKEGSDPNFDNYTSSNPYGYEGNQKYDEGEPFIDTPKPEDEPFIDEKNGAYDSPEKFQDENFNRQWDEGEYFVDTNKNGQYDSGDMLLDINKNGIYDEDVDKYVDIVGNGIYDEGEKFTDLNNNGIYDRGPKLKKSNHRKNKFIAYDVAPQMIKGKEIRLKYPSIAKSAGIEGSVTVEFYIDKKGDVLEVKVLKGTGTILDKAVIDAVKKSKWKPARQRDKKVGVWITQKLSFRMN